MERDIIAAFIKYAVVCELLTDTLEADAVLEFLAEEIRRYDTENHTRKLLQNCA